MITAFKNISFLLCLLFLNPTIANTQTTLEQRLKTIQQQLNKGHVNAAWDLAEQTQQQLKDSNQITPTEKLVFLTVYAEAAIRSQNLKKAGILLNLARDQAQSQKNPELLAKLSQRFGLWYALNNKIQDAEEWYGRASRYAEKTGETALQISTQINLASVQQTPNLKPAYQLIQQLDNKTEQQEFLLSLAHKSKDKQPDLALQAIQQLLAINPNELNSRTHSQALTYLAEIYAQQNRLSDAQKIIQQAISLDHSPDLLVKSKQLHAKWLKQLGKPELAKQAYRHAVKHIQTIRQDIPIYYPDGQSSFRTTLAPVYLGLIELLLDKSQKKPTQLQLNEVQGLWEQFKSAELNDYFRAICKTTTDTSNLNQGIANQSGTAIIYPIILSERLEILLSIQGKIWHFSQPVSKKQLKQTVDSLFNNIIQANPISAHKQLNQWILEPLETILSAHQIETLIYIPDGVLRRIPLDVLHDGKQYAIEKYAIITNPGLSMLPTNKISIKNNKILLAGMSDPGSVVKELIDKNIFSFDVGKTAGRNLSENMTETQRQTRIGELTQSLALPGVKEELKSLSEMLDTPVMENQQFVLNNFKQAVEQGQSIIHIASHGFFSGDPEKSFVLTYDRLLTMNQMIELFKSEAFIDSPVDLISLSACETAEGDDRSPLGLSGVVVQAGVRNAIGSLWSVADKQTQQLFTRFYQNYLQQGQSKAQALRNAQIYILKQKESQHPYFWAPFILIGNG